LKVLKDYPEKQVNKLIAYHKANGGLSRYVKFRYFFEEIRKEDVSDEEIQELAMRFSLIMLENLKKPEFLISQTVNFIKHTYENYKMFIVSGSDQKELRQICKAVEIEKFFKGIYGSPTAKDELVKHLIDTENIESATSILIGDSVNDFEAAKVNGIKFYGFNNPALTTVSKNYISKFS
jgi:HAD superfamily hydrolase (TIGR01549 family)